MQGNLALTFLFKDQDLHEIIKFKKGSNGTKNESSPDNELNRKTSTKL